MDNSTCTSPEAGLGMQMGGWTHLLGHVLHSPSHSRKKEAQGSWHFCVMVTSTSAIPGAGWRCTWGPGKAAPDPAEQG